MPLYPPSGSITGTPEAIGVFDSGGVLSDGPSGVYRMSADTLSDLYLAWNLESGGAGAVGVLYAEEPLTPGQDGFALGILAGPGAPGLGATPGGDGGLYEGYGGFGGDGTAAAPAGIGGEVQIASAPAGANNGGGGNRAGDVYIDGSDGTGAGRAGDVLLGTYTPGVYGTRYVRVGPDGSTIPLLIDRSAPVGSELLNVKSDTDTMSILGRGVYGSWVAADELNISHYDYRASATGYGYRVGASGLNLVNSPATVAASQLLYLQLGGSFAQGWQIGDGSGNAHLKPFGTGALDLGGSSNKARDLYLSRDAYVGDDIEFLQAVDHEIYVAESTSAVVGGSLTVRAGTGFTHATTPTNGGTLYLWSGPGGNGGAAPSTTGGNVDVLAYEGFGDASVGGDVNIDAEVGNDDSTGGRVNLGLRENSFIKIASATGWLSFFEATEVQQQAHIADADGTLAGATATINAILNLIEAYGLMAP